MATNKDYVQLCINVTPEERDEFNHLIKKRGYRFGSDYLRDLIVADAAAHEMPVNFHLERGGNRRSKKAEE